MIVYGHEKNLKWLYYAVGWGTINLYLATTETKKEECMVWWSVDVDVIGDDVDDDDNDTTIMTVMTVTTMMTMMIMVVRRGTRSV